MISLNFAFVKLFFTKNEKNLGAPFEAPKYKVFSLSNIIDQAVVAVVSTVYNCKRFTIVYVAESKEIMLKEVHLEDSFLAGHRLKVELLDANDAQIIFPFFGGEGGFFHCTCKGILAETACKSCFILADLAFNGANSGIDRGEHIGSAFACPEPSTCAVNGKLYLIPVLLHRKEQE